MIEKMEYKGFVITIEHDQYTSSPREWDNLGTMVSFHSRYTLGDKTEFKDHTALMEYITETQSIWLSVFLMDHSGLSLSSGDFGCRWDSGQVGMIFVTREKILENYGDTTQATLDKVTSILKAEIEDYNRFLSGDIFTYTVTRGNTCKTCEHTETEHVDGCGGFYGMEDAIDAAKESIDAELSQSTPPTKVLG